MYRGEEIYKESRFFFLNNKFLFILEEYFVWNASAKSEFNNSSCTSLDKQKCFHYCIKLCRLHKQMMVLPFDATTETSLFLLTGQSLA